MCLFWEWKLIIRGEGRGTSEINQNFWLGPSLAAFIERIYKNNDSISKVKEKLKVSNKKHKKGELLDLQEAFIPFGYF